ncbi:hypothetical protein CHUAL_003409 [Chamberlinius hualienensis]
MMDYFDSECTSCARLKSDLSELRELHIPNVATLKKKIIMTDELIRKYNEQREQLELKTKLLNDATELITDLQNEHRQTDSQLKKNLMNFESVKKENEKFLSENKLLSERFQEVQRDLLVSEKVKQQYEVMVSENTEKESRVKDELTVLKLELAKAKKSLTKLSKDKGRTLT